MKFELARGVRDFAPEEQILRQELLSSIRSVFERYGYSPMETPIIERFDTLTAKFAAGEGTDVMREIFRFKDQGGRDLGLKFDQTVPLGRFMASNPTLKLPFKRYTIDRSFRDGPIKLGRYREFMQCDVDIVGSKSALSDAEIVMLTVDVFKALKLDVTVEVNNRKLLFAILNYAGIPKDKQTQSVIIIDKLKKISREDMLKEFAAIGVDEGAANTLIDTVSVKGSPDEILTGLQVKFATDEKALEAIKEATELFSYLENDNVVLNLALARGLNYYTGTVIEAFLKDSEVTSSVAGGGRYDDMIGEYVGRGEYPAIGVSFGIAPIVEALKLSGYDRRKTVTKVLIIPIGQTAEGLKLAAKLRAAGINTAIDLNAKGVSKNLNYANNYAIPFVIFLGEEEVNSGVVKLKDMDSGEESKLTFDDAIKKLV